MSVFPGKLRKGGGSLTTDTTKLVRDVHPQDIENSKFKIVWKGYVKFNIFYNNRGMRSTEGFLPYEIPVDPILNEQMSCLYAEAR